jgi:hypothetical protein
MTYTVPLWFAIPTLMSMAFAAGFIWGRVYDRRRGPQNGR